MQEKQSMGNVTDITLQVNGNDVLYHVSFHDELYVFKPADGKSNAPNFILRRDHNDWESENAMDKTLMNQAKEKLEHFLLSQH